MSVSTVAESAITPAANSASRRAALWIAAVFILGTALGIAGGYFFGLRASAAVSAPQSDDARRQQKIAVLTKTLDLTPQQQTQIDAIFVDTQSKFKEVRKGADAQIEVFRQAGRERVRAVLTPEQRPKFEDFLRQLDENRKNRPEGPH